MNKRNACGLGAGSMRVLGCASITAGLLVALSTLAAAQTIPQNTTGRNPGTQIPPGAAVPEATTAASQTMPEKRIQSGVGGVSADSFKFGEYNGLENSGPFGIGNLDLRGGAAYDSKDTWRWRLQGSNLGLENRNLILDFGKQGRFQIRLAYNEILANRSDSFHSPYLGVGTGSLTLPSNWIEPIVPQISATALNLRSLDPVAGTGSVYNKSGVLTPPAAAQLATLAAIRAADVPDFQNVHISLKRTRGEAQLLFSPSKKIDVPVSYSYEHKDGNKIVGAVTSQVTQNSALLPYKVDWDTNQASAALNYKRKKLYVSAAYYGSFFHNNTDTITWADPANPAFTPILAEEPSNQFNQVTLTASYKFSKAAKLVVVGTGGRGTQNQPFVNPALVGNGQLAFGLPRPSLNGVVYTALASAKFTAKHKQWEYIADFRFDDRDNQTPVAIWFFQDDSEPKSATPSPFAGLYGMPSGLGSNTDIYNNRSLSKASYKANAQAEYAKSRSQHFTAGYGWERTDRHCSYSWITCADAPEVNENTARAEYRKSRGVLTARLEYAFSARRGDYNEDAFLAETPMANNTPAGGATTSLLGYLQKTGLTGFGPVAGLPATPLTGDAAIYSPNNNTVPQALYGTRNILNEIPGFRRFYVADRDRNHARTEFDWNAKDKFSLQGSGEFDDDNYPNTKLGLKRRTWWAATLDASYTASEDLVADVFYTYDNQRLFSAGDAYGTNSTTAFQGQAGNTVVAGPCFTTVAAKNASAKIDPCLNFVKNDRDKIDTAGFTLRRKNLAAGKLELASEVMYTRARTRNAAVGGSYVNNPLALAAPAPPLPSGTPATFYISAADYPLVRNDQISVVPSATYAISKSARLQGFYWYQRLMSSDWRYEGLQYGTKTNFLPTLEVAPSYDVHVAGLSLTWTF
jgi:MtrB/PioB family decaheme-associated outer membrane protein